MFAENEQRMKQVEESFLKPPSLAKTDRLLVGEGNIYKICRASEQKRRIILFNDILIIAKISPNQKCYDPTIFKLEEVEITEAPSSNDYKNAWNINSPQKSFMVCTSSIEEKKLWMTHVRNFAVKRREHMGISELPETAAVWIPNSGANSCMCCKKYEFSIIRRKHHCRKCGIVVCGPCSENKIVIENMNQPKPMRVCFNCFNVSKNKNQPKKYTPSQSDEEESKATFYEY